MKKVITFKGWKLTLDSDQIFPADPGQGTPALVTSPKGSTGTYSCAVSEGFCDNEELPGSVLDWLASQNDIVDNFLDSFNGDNNA